MDREMSVSCSNRTAQPLTPGAGSFLVGNTEDKTKGLPKPLPSSWASKGEDVLSGAREGVQQGLQHLQPPQNSPVPCQRCSAGGTGGTRPKMPNSQL